MRAASCALLLPRSAIDTRCSSQRLACCCRLSMLRSRQHAAAGSSKNPPKIQQALELE